DLRVIRSSYTAWSARSPNRIGIHTGPIQVHRGVARIVKGDGHMVPACADIDVCIDPTHALIENNQMVAGIVKRRTADADSIAIASACISLGADFHKRPIARY